MRLAAPREVAISCRDLEAMTAFYGGVVGLELVKLIEMPAARAPATGGYRVARLQTSGGERIRRLEPLEQMATVPAIDPKEIRLRAQAFFISFIVGDLDAVLQRLRATGGKAEARPGPDLAFALDPEGNLLELACHDALAGYPPELADCRTRSLVLVG